MSRREGGEKTEGEGERRERERRAGQEGGGRREHEGGSREGRPRPLAQSWPSPAPAPAPRRAPGRTCRAHTPPARRASEPPPPPPSARTRCGSPAQPSLGAGRSHPSLRDHYRRRRRGTAEPARRGTEASPGWALGRAHGPPRSLATLRLQLQLRGGRAGLAPPRSVFSVRSILPGARHPPLSARASCSERSVLFTEHPP